MNRALLPLLAHGEQLGDLTAPGSAGNYFLVDRASGTGMSITLWESEDALNASVERANQMREEATEQAGASIQAVDHYEVALTVG